MIRYTRDTWAASHSRHRSPSLNTEQPANEGAGKTQNALLLATAQLELGQISCAENSEPLSCKGRHCHSPRSVRALMRRCSRGRLGFCARNSTVWWPAEVESEGQEHGMARAGIARFPFRLPVDGRSGGGRRRTAGNGKPQCHCMVSNIRRHSKHLAPVSSQLRHCSKNEMGRRSNGTRLSALADNHGCFTACVSLALSGQRDAYPPLTHCWGLPAVRSIRFLPWCAEKVEGSLRSRPSLRPERFQRVLSRRGI